MHNQLVPCTYPYSPSDCKWQRQTPAALRRLCSNRRGFFRFVFRKCLPPNRTVSCSVRTRWVPISSFHRYIFLKLPQGSKTWSTIELFKRIAIPIYPAHRPSVRFCLTLLFSIWFVWCMSKRSAISLFQRKRLRRARWSICIKVTLFVQFGLPFTFPVWQAESSSLNKVGSVETANHKAHSKWRLSERSTRLDMLTLNQKAAVEQ